jgi:hypothetical protein
MSAEQKDIEQNALAAKLTGWWGDFKQGKLIGYKWLAGLLIVTAAVGITWYISSEKKKAGSKQWLAFDEANTVAKLEEIVKKDPQAPTARIAELLIARGLLGPDGIELLNSRAPEQRQKAIENIEKARESFGKLLPQFEKDPVFKAECLLGLAKAEAVLVGVPLKSDQPVGIGPAAPTRDAKGKVETVIKYLDELAAAAAPDTPWATESKKMADTLRANPGKFVDIQQALTQPPAPKFDDPHGPLGPLGPDANPFGPGGLPK